MDTLKKHLPVVRFLLRKIIALESENRRRRICREHDMASEGIYPFGPTLPTEFQTSTSSWDRLDDHSKIQALEKRILYLERKNKALDSKNRHLKYCAESDMRLEVERLPASPVLQFLKDKVKALESENRHLERLHGGSIQSYWAEEGYCPVGSMFLTGFQLIRDLEEHLLILERMNKALKSENRQLRHSGGSDMSFWRDAAGYSGEIVSSGGTATIPGCDSGPIQLVYDAGTDSSPALAGVYANSRRWREVGGKYKVAENGFGDDLDRDNDRLFLDRRYMDARIARLERAVAAFSEEKNRLQHEVRRLDDRVESSDKKCKERETVLQGLSNIVEINQRAIGGLQNTVVAHNGNIAQLLRK